MNRIDIGKRRDRRPVTERTEWTNAVSEDAKKRAAVAALEFIEDGMCLGLGTGSTANHFIEALGHRIRAGLQVTGVATSKGTEELANKCGVPLTDLQNRPILDLAVDGADEIGPDLALIKGGGGALLREKIVAKSARRMVVIGDDSKLVGELGRFPLPIEIIDFGLAPIINDIRDATLDLGMSVDLMKRKKDDRDFITDEGHVLLDADFGHIADPISLAGALDAIPGVVEHGLFIELADTAIVAGPAGIRHLKR